MSVSLDTGIRGYIALRALDEIQQEYTVRIAECVIVEAVGSQLLIACPGEVGTQAGIWSSVLVSDINSCPVSIHKVKASAFRTTIADPQSAIKFQSPLKLKDLLAKHGSEALKTSLTDSERVEDVPSMQSPQTYTMQPPLMPMPPLPAPSPYPYLQMPQPWNQPAPVPGFTPGEQLRMKTAKQLHAKLDLGDDDDAEDGEADESEEDDEDLTGSKRLERMVKAAYEKMKKKPSTASRPSGSGSAAAAPVPGVFAGVNGPMPSPPAAPVPPMPTSTPTPTAEGGTMEMLMLMMMEEMINRRKGKDQLSDEWMGEEMDGLRTMKALSKGRAVREHQKKFPLKTVKEYIDSWEEKLHAQHRPWDWSDVADDIGMSHVKSIHRVFLMVGHIETLLREHKYKLAHLEAVQTLKALHQFAEDSSWKAAMRYSSVPDPYHKRRLGGTEAELEAILGTLKVEEDLSKKTKNFQNNGNQGDKDKTDADGDAAAKGGGKGVKK